MPWFSDKVPEEKLPAESESPVVDVRWFSEVEEGKEILGMNKAV